MRVPAVPVAVSHLRRGDGQGLVSGFQRLIIPPLFHAAVGALHPVQQVRQLIPPTVARRQRHQHRKPASGPHDSKSGVHLVPATG